MTALLLKYWKQIALVVCIAITAALLYNKVYNIGYDAASTEYKQEIEKLNSRIAKKIDRIEQNSNILIASRNNQSRKDAEDFQKIIDAIQNKDLVVIRNGECEPSPAMIQTLNDAIKKANK